MAGLAITAGAAWGGNPCAVLGANTSPGAESLNLGGGAFITGMIACTGAIT